MATCCNPVTAPTCTPTPCPQLYNACCVINEANLPCLYPPVDASGVSTAYSYNITNVEVFGGDAIEDIVTGMTAFTVVDSVETAIGKVTVDSLLTTVTLDTAPATYSGNLVFKFVEQTQCDINEAVDAAICALQAGTVPCFDFTSGAMTLTAPWTAVASGNPQAPEYSAPTFCTIRLRGAVQREFNVAEQDTTCTLRSFAITTLPAAQHPLFNRLLPTTVLVIETTNPSSNVAHCFPAFMAISTAGVVTVLFYVDHCLTFANQPYKVTVSFDGLTYETN